MQRSCKVSSRRGGLRGVAYAVLFATVASQASAAPINGGVEAPTPDLFYNFYVPPVPAGAYPGVGAEERGQAEAIARSIEKCLALTVPMVSVITGEGGSGGAIAIAAANRIYMLEHSIYSVASPEAAASIVWRDATRARDVAAAMKITAQDLLQLGVIDGIIAEPAGGAHRDPGAVMQATAATIREALRELAEVDGEQVRRLRREKFLAMGRNLG